MCSYEDLEALYRREEWCVEGWGGAQGFSLSLIQVQNEFSSLEILPDKKKREDVKKLDKNNAIWHFKWKRQKTLGFSALNNMFIYKSKDKKLLDIPP